MTLARPIDSTARRRLAIEPRKAIGAMECSRSAGSACEETQFGERLHGARRPSVTPRLVGRRQLNIAAMLPSRSWRQPMQISAQQLAELLLGIARAQAAMIQGLENEMAGIRSGRIIPALQNVAHLRDHPNPTLTDLPSRVLLGTLGRAVPDAASVVRDLERLLGGGAPAAG